MGIIDTHAHLYLDVFDVDRHQVIQRAKNAGVELILFPAIDAASHDKMLEVQKTYPQFIFAMMGLHPCSVREENWEEAMADVAARLSTGSFVAIGETGLDLYWDKSTLPWQQMALERQCALALEHNLPICLHTRDAIDACIEQIKPWACKGLRGVFHCFSGNVLQAQAIADMGFYMGIGGVLTFKNAGLDKVLNEVGVERLVLETDAPYLAPVPYRGKRNESAYISHVLARLVDITGLSQTALVHQTSGNARKLFKLPA